MADDESKPRELLIREMKQLSEALRQRVGELDAEAARIEERDRQQARSDALASLATGVALDMNNMLAAIMGWASALHADAPTDSTARHDTEGILAACAKGRSVIKNLLDFARDGKSPDSPIDLNETVGALAARIDADEAGIRVRKRLQPEPAVVRASAPHLEQVLGRAADDAVAAMDAAGAIELATDTVILDRSGPENHQGLHAGRYVRVRIFDTRPIAADAEAGPYEPFFTASPREGAAGVDLAVLYGTIRSYGGTVSVQNRPDKGRLVTVYLPAADDELPARRERMDTADPSEAVDDPSREISQPGTVLVVDDEELVLESIARQLRRLGFDVVLASDGPTAVELYRERGADIELVIVDYVMPDMDGERVLQEIKAIDPDAKVLISSGYGKDRLLGRSALRDAEGFLHKPYTLKRLAAAIDEIRGRPPRRVSAPRD